MALYIALKNKVFNFQNFLIKDTLYQLTPPSDALRVHHGTAQFIEKHYSADLRPYYGQLSYHYKLSLGERAAAFKYSVKAADQAISRGAFAKGLEFCSGALEMAKTCNELDVFSVVISRGYEDLRLGDTSSSSSTQKVKFTLDNFTNRMIKDFNRIRTSDKILKNGNNKQNTRLGSTSSMDKTDTQYSTSSMDNTYTQTSSDTQTSYVSEVQHDIIERKNMIERYKKLKIECKKMKIKLTYDYQARRSTNNTYIHRTIAQSYDINDRLNKQKKLKKTGTRSTSDQPESTSLFDSENNGNSVDPYIKHSPLSKGSPDPQLMQPVKRNSISLLLAGGKRSNIAPEVPTYFNIDELLKNPRKQGNADGKVSARGELKWQASYSASKNEQRPPKASCCVIA